MSSEVFFSASHLGPDWAAWWMMTTFSSMESFDVHGTSFEPLAPMTDYVECHGIHALHSDNKSLINPP
jgi:hypothetical protein